jgi:hypothetical protein
MTTIALEQRCTATKEDGIRCRVTVSLCPDCGRCFWHCPHRAEQRRAAASKGGKAGGPGKRWKKGRPHHARPDQAPPQPRTLDDCVRWSSWLAWAVSVGVIDSGTGRVAVQAIGQLVRSIEKRDLEREIDELRSQVKLLKRQYGARDGH